MINDRKEEEMIAEIASELNETMSMMYNFLFNVQNAGSNLSDESSESLALYTIVQLYDESKHCKLFTLNVFH